TIAGIVKQACELAPVDWVPGDLEALRRLLDEAIQTYAKKNGLPLAGNDAPDRRILWAHPMGVLATDHVGYLPFDLSRRPADLAKGVGLAVESRRRDPSKPTGTVIWLYPMAREEGRIDALAQMRFAHDAIVVKVELDRPQLAADFKNLGFMAMQNPDLTDW